DLHNLTHMELCHSKNLVKIPNLSQAPNLEKLNLYGCVKLVHLDASIGSLEKLSFLNLGNCKNLVNIPNSIFHLNSLQILSLSGCSKLFKYQLLEKPRKSEQLNTCQSVQTHMTSSICKTLTRPLHFISSTRRRANSVGLLFPSWSHLSALTYLDISFCNLVQIPDAVGNLRCLEWLNIGGNNTVTLPDCIKELPKLRELNLQYCMTIIGLALLVVQHLLYIMFQLNSLKKRDIPFKLVMVFVVGVWRFFTEFQYVLRKI
ncbi:hypothetical protein PIB30_095480, partial [Stylosanthes scabra]|nr:hypothetical protein [Stylosanthes scabra]